MKMATNFDIKKYIGKWYDIAHYPSWFQPNYAYNTTAEYSIESSTITPSRVSDKGGYLGIGELGNDTLKVINKSYIDAKIFISEGKAIKYQDNLFEVIFDKNNYKFLLESGYFQMESFKDFIKGPNYKIMKVWSNEKGDYNVAIVSNETKSTFYLLCRTPFIDKQSWEVILYYINQHFDMKKIIYTLHTL